MRIRHRRSTAATAVATATAVLAVALAAPGAGAATPKIPNIPRIPNLPRAPKVTKYKALLDVAGYIDVKVERDTTQECMPGQDVTIEFESSFELGRPRETAITVVNGAVISGLVANRGGVSHKGTLAGYRETNYCPPARRVELEKPGCTSASGKLSALLGSDVRGADGLGPDDLTPLSFPVNLLLTRVGGASQPSSCRRYLSSGLQSALDNGTDLSVFDLSASALTIPIGAHDGNFRRLGTGQWLRRVVRLNGACDHVLVGRGTPAVPSRKYDRANRCTVTGEIYVGVKRVE